MDGSSGKKLKGRSRKPTEFPGVAVLGMSSEWGMCRKPTVTQATKSCGREEWALLRTLREERGGRPPRAPFVRNGQTQHRVRMWSWAGAGRRRGRYLFFDVVIVLKELLEDHRWVPGVVLVKDAAAVQFRLPVLGHGQGVPVGGEARRFQALGASRPLPGSGMCLSPHFEIISWESAGLIECQVGLRCTERALHTPPQTERCPGNTHAHTCTHMHVHSHTCTHMQTHHHTDSVSHRQKHRRGKAQGGASCPPQAPEPPHLAQVIPCSTPEPGGSTWKAMELMCSR